MADQNLVKFLQSGNASPEEIEDFKSWCIDLCADGGKTARYHAYRLWAKILWKPQTPFKMGTHFDYDNALKNYLRSISGGDITDAEKPKGSVYVSAQTFVHWVVRNLDAAF